MNTNAFIFRTALDNVSDYALTGGDRTADITVTDDQVLKIKNVSCVEKHDLQNPGLFKKSFWVNLDADKFPTGVQKVRLMSVKACIDGSDYARAGVGKFAFAGRVYVTNGSIVGCSLPIQVPEYNVEYPIDVTLATKTNGVTAIVFDANATFTLDDFGIDSAFVGQTVTPYLEFTAELLG